MQPDTVYKRGGSTDYAPLPLPSDGTPPQIDPRLFPPRFGYPQTVPGIMDVLSMARLYPDHSSDISGASAGGYSATSRPSMSWW